MGKNNDRGGNYSRNNYTQGKRNNDSEPSYVGAPYNFVSFCKNTYEIGKEALVPQNKLSEELYTGEISYKVVSQTEIIVDNGKGNFCKDNRNRYVIPGSTMRGLIRNNLQVLGCCSYAEDIDDYNLMYRDFTNDPLKKTYDEVLGNKQVSIFNKSHKSNFSILKHVAAGYIEKNGDEYVIYKTKLESISPNLGAMNYYVLSERAIINNYIDAQKGKGNFLYKVFEEDGKSILQHEFFPFKQVEKKGKKNWEGEENKEYKPYVKEISYKIKNDRTVEAVDEIERYPNKGVVLSSGKMKDKKVIYIIPEIGETTIQLNHEDVETFKIDFNKRKNVLGRNAEFYNLPKENGKKGRKPVFYIQYKGKVYFGFTPRLRLFYDYSIFDGLPDSHKQKEFIDFDKSILGYAGENFAYKSKVSFSDAVMQDSKKELDEKSVILGEPKPTSYMNYLKQDTMNKQSEIKTYNSDCFELRGAKQYWLQKDVRNVVNANKNVSSKFKPLPSNSEFYGKIRFHSMTKEELGLLLWSIQLRPESQMNVGKAKAYGYGRIKLSLEKFLILDLKKAYTLDEFHMNPYKEMDGNAFIKDYKDYMNERLGKNIEELNSVKEFFALKNVEHMPLKEKIRYMEIQHNGPSSTRVNEFQKQKLNHNPLPRTMFIAKEKRNEEKIH